MWCAGHTLQYSIWGGWPAGYDLRVLHQAVAIGVYVGGLSQAMATLLLTAPRPVVSPPEKALTIEVVPDLLTVVDGALTAIAIVMGGIFAYYKYLKGRGIGAPAGLELTASVVQGHDQRRFMLYRRSADALVVEVGIRNNGILTVTVPKNSTQLVSVSSISDEEVVRAGPSLTQGALSWKRPDAYFASTNILLDNGQEPEKDIKLRQGQVLPLAAVFPVPHGHHAAAFLIVLNSYVESGWRFRRAGNWTEMRKLVVPGRETWSGRDGA